VPQPTLRWRRIRFALFLAGCLALAASRPAAAAADTASGPGVICIAPFHVEEPEPGRPPLAAGPNMSQTTWGPGADSVFTFRIDKRPRVAVRNHEMLLISGLPVDRKVKVEVRLDDKPFEAFSLNLGGKPEQRVCLWLYGGYWHWVDIGWDAVRGCKCETAAARREEPPTAPTGSPPAARRRSGR
jgi:hypothetical protein